MTAWKNLTKVEFKAIRTLKNNGEIIVKQADKGSDISYKAQYTAEDLGN